MTVSEDQARALAAFSTPTLFNGLKKLGVAVEALQNVDPHAVRCLAPGLGTRVGFAATRRVATRTSGPPADLVRTTEQNRLMAAHVASLPGPRFMVVENLGDWRGRMCVWGEVAAHINVAMGCVAGLTNGPARDIAEMEAAGFAAFASGPATGGGHVDFLDVGQPVVIGGLSIAPGDLLAGDVHGVIKIPPELAAELPAAIAAVEASEAKIIALCRSGNFTPEALEALMSGGSVPPR